jgi:hypothetical protein
LLSVPVLLLAFIAPNPDPGAPLLRATTAKSVDEFGACFTRAQDQHARAWAFLPSDGGGTFTDSGAGGVVAPYWLQVSEARPLNNIRLFAAAGSNHPNNLVEAVNRCR